MDKKKISSLLTGMIVFMALMIVVLLAVIIKRGAEPLEKAKTPIPTPTSSNGVMFASDKAKKEAAKKIEESRIKRMAAAKINANTGVNVRTGPGTDTDVLLSADPGQFCEVLDAPADGWTHIMYGSREGFISSDYLIYGLLVIDGSGKTEFTEMSYEEAKVAASSAVSEPAVSTNEATE